MTTIKERAGCLGADIIATPKRYHLEIYLPGPDLRYNGVMIKISHDEIDAFIENYQNAFERYQSLLQEMADLNATVKFGRLTIRTTKPFQGVCLENYHHAINSPAELERLIAALQSAKNRGQALVRAANLIFENT